MISTFIIILVTLMQMSMNGFAGFDFGSDKGLVNSIISQKQSVVLIKDQEDTLKYSSGMFNGFPVGEW